MRNADRQSVASADKQGDGKMLEYPAPTGDVSAIAAASEIAAVSASEDLPEEFFDYAEVADTEKRRELIEIVSTIREAHRRHIEAVIHTGCALLKAKAILGHGNFGRWLQAEFRWSERTATNYMSVAQHFVDKTEIIADLELTSAYALAAKSTPQQVRDDVTSRLAAGEGVTAAQVKAAIDKAKRTRGAATHENDKERERQEKAAIEAANIVIKSLGKKLPAFIKLVQEADLEQFRKALLSSGNALAADAAGGNSAN
jgi:hypothetical protein